MLLVLILLILLFGGFGGFYGGPDYPYRAGGLSLAGLMLIILLIWLLAGPGLGWRPLY
jgi:hypothetical protein